MNTPAPRRPRQVLPPADPLRYAPTRERPLRAKAREMAAAMDIQPHHHDWGQLVFSVSGAVRVSADAADAHSTYLVPPSRAVWIPAGVTHAVTVVERADLRTLYLLPGLLETPADDAWHRCRVLEVSPLLRELVMQLDAHPISPIDTPPDAARETLLRDLIVDELRRAQPLRLGVDLPRDPRLRRLCEAMLDEPARHLSLDAWATEIGASARTVSRLFREELGTSFAQWRSQVMLAHALAMAARRKPMSHIAAELGYASASAFTAMVTRTVGMPPSRFFAEA
ncbi:helix-turn-helix transcriptional regulator [Roseateles asaccharophilus]|uniref:AraC-like DNA-binding protein n=1 Tax=Roseateles asaccharophilus TaxID=582607 RepID=A0ABU2A373_9BURK|nr:helix-turn-helix transcriptional regulator [Roseateles asaccharophilus]MDR7331637.1 AraC-like DNA-binding protein [Roseateles asaccharophilus]